MFLIFEWKPRATSRHAGPLDNAAMASISKRMTTRWPLLLIAFLLAVLMTVRAFAGFEPRAPQKEGERGSVPVRVL
jgi:hypothetical protein